MRTGTEASGPSWTVAKPKNQVAYAITTAVNSQPASWPAHQRLPSRIAPTSEVA